MESCPTQAVLPLVGLAAEKVIRDPYNPYFWAFKERESWTIHLHDVRFCSRLAWARRRSG
ncbi:MAG: hypothetical protein ACQESR_23825 [Planctomycetota bacterium]